MRSVVAVFGGDYDVTCKTRLRDGLARLASKPALVLDLSDVEYVDSAFVAELLAMQQRRTRAGFEVASIVVRSPLILRLFRILDLERVFKIYNSLDECLGDDADVLRLDLKNTAGRLVRT